MYEAAGTLSFSSPPCWKLDFCRNLAWASEGTRASGLSRPPLTAASFTVGNGNVWGWRFKTLTSILHVQSLKGWAQHCRKLENLQIVEGFPSEQPSLSCLSQAAVLLSPNSGCEAQRETLRQTDVSSSPQRGHPRVWGGTVHAPGLHPCYPWALPLPSCWTRPGLCGKRQSLLASLCALPSGPPASQSLTETASVPTG